MINPLIKAKFRAFLIHISLSALVLFTFLAIVWFIWYPNGFFDVEGGWAVAVVLVAVDLVLGPALTFLVFNPEKKELYFDLSVIALVQIIAFGYGGMTIFQQRPQFVAFSDTQFVLIPAASINTDELSDKTLSNSPFSPPKFVYVHQPETAAERKEVIKQLADGKDVSHLPKYYRPYEKNWAAILRMPHLDIQFILKNHPEQKPIITAMAQGVAIDSLMYYVLQGSVKRQVLVLNPNDGKMLGTLAVDPGI